MTTSYLSPVFVIGHIRIGSVEGASCVNLGNNLPSQFTSNSKQNQGFGKISGDGNDLRDIAAAMKDSSLLETFDSPNETETPEWIQKLAAEVFAANAADEEE